MPRWTDAAVSGPYLPMQPFAPRGGAFCFVFACIYIYIGAETLPWPPWMGTRGRFVLWMADECVLWDVREMTVLPAKGEIRAEGGDTGCFEWSRKIWFENAVYGGRPNWRQDIRGGECLCAWKKICVEKYMEDFFFFLFLFFSSRFGKVSEVL